MSLRISKTNIFPNMNGNVVKRKSANLNKTTSTTPLPSSNTTTQPVKKRGCSSCARRR